MTDKFIEAYNAEADAMLKAMNDHLERLKRMYPQLHRVGWPKCNQATRLRWGKSKKARLRRFWSFIERRKKAGIDKRNCKHLQADSVIYALSDPRMPKGRILLVNKDMTSPMTIRL